MHKRQFVWIRTYNSNDIKTRIIFACEYGGIKKSELCSKIGVSQSSFSQRLDNGKFTKQELVDIAKAIGCKYKGYFRHNNGMIFDAPTIGQQTKDALEYCGMTIVDLSVKMGLTRQATSKRLSIGKLSQDDLEEIARYMDCDYISVFEFEDGTEI